MLHVCIDQTIVASAASVLSVARLHAIAMHQSATSWAFWRARQSVSQKRAGLCLFLKGAPLCRHRWRRLSNQKRKILLSCEAFLYL
jgi:hypothetical protein